MTKIADFDLVTKVSRPDDYCKTFSTCYQLSNGI